MRTLANIALPNKLLCVIKAQVLPAVFGTLSDKQQGWPSVGGQAYSLANTVISQAGVVWIYHWETPMQYILVCVDTVVQAKQRNTDFSINMDSEEVVNGQHRPHVVSEYLH